VVLLSPLLFRPRLSEGLLVAPFACVLSGPAWHYTPTRSDDTGPALQYFCVWLRQQAHEAAV
jgi:LysR family glycine cleavage system transcriptional activator